MSLPHGFPASSHLGSVGVWLEYCVASDVCVISHILFLLPLLSTIAFAFCTLHCQNGVLVRLFIT